MAHTRKASQSGIVAPTTVTPHFTGQVYYDTANSLSYISKSKTTGDWILLGAGDMTKAVYDININSIVDKSEELDDGAGSVVTALQARSHIDDTTVHFTAPVFGNDFQYVESLGVSITTSTTLQTKIDFITTDLPAGNYKIEWSYGWNHDKNKNDFHGILALNNDFTQNNLLMEHLQEPQQEGGNGTNKYVSTGTDQLFVSSGFMIVNLSGVNNLKLQFRTTNDADESSIWNSVISLHRVS